MTLTSTPRMNLPQASSDSDNWPARAGWNAIFATLEDRTAYDIQVANTAARPAAGIRGRYCWVEDINTLYRDNGSAWKLVATESTKLSQLAAPDAAVPMGGQKFTGLGAGAASGDSVTKGQLDSAIAALTAVVAASSVPSGVVAEWPVDAAAPAGWLLADGSAVSRATYAGIFAVYGTLHGAGNGSTTFNLPNWKGRTSVGKDAAQTEFDTIGETGGAKAHILSEAELPAHHHAIDHNHAAVTSSAAGGHSHSIPIKWSSAYDGSGGSPAVINVGGGGGAGGGTTSGDTDSVGNHTHSVDLPNYTGNSGDVGSGAGHNNLQPYIVTHFIIKI